MMKRITAIFLFLLLQIVTDIDSEEWHSLDPRDDMTEHLMNIMNDMLQNLNGKTLRNLFEKWNSQNWTPEQHSVTINSTIIHFPAKTVKDMTEFSFYDMYCSFGESVKIWYNKSNINYQQIGFKRDERFFYGVVQFIESGNFSSCQANFTRTIDNNLISLSIKSPNQFTFDKIIESTEVSSQLNTDIVKSDEKLCNDKNENQRQLVRTAVKLAFEETLREKYQQMLKQIGQPMLNRCLLPNFLKNNIENHYVRLKTECNAAAFPWLTDCDDLIIRGWNNFPSFHTDRNDYFTYFEFKYVNVHWDVISMVPKEYNIDMYILEIDPEHDIYAFSNFVTEKLPGHYTRTLDVQLKRKLRKLLRNGIKEAYAKTQCVTESFRNTLNKILQPLNKQTLRTSFVDLETTPEEKIFFKDTTFDLKIGTEGFRLGKMKCFSDTMNISTLSYKKIRSQFIYFHSIEKSNVNNLRVSVDVCIKEATTYISLQQNQTSKIESGIQFDDNFNNADTTITIASGNHRLTQAERQSIGKSIFEKFVDTIRNKIKKSANSMFHPVFHICKNSRSSSTESHSANLSDRHPYFSKIVDYWINSASPFSTQRIDITLNGTWNFKFIEVRLMEESVMVDGLRLENVVGEINIKEMYNSNKEWTLDYNMSYFSLIINHREKNIRVQLPPPTEYWINSSDFSLHPKNAAIVMKKLQYSVASYIEQSIYNDPDYLAKFRTTAASIIKKASEDISPEYDVSSKFINWLTQTLQKIVQAVMYFDTSESILEEICDCSNNFESEPISAVNCSVCRNVQCCKVKRNCTTNMSDEEIDDPLQLSNFSIKPTEFLISLLKDPSKYYTRAYFCESYFKRLKFSEKHFYFIEGTIAYTPDHFSMYQIRIYGLHNLKLLRFKLFETHDNSGYLQFEIIVANLTTHIRWIQNIGGLLPKIPYEMKLKIDEIILAGDAYTHMYAYPGEITFTNRSQLLFSEQENSWMVEKLKDTLTPIILNSIQLSMAKKFLMMNDQ